MNKILYYRRNMDIALLPGIDKLLSLDLPVGKFLIFGSGPLVVRGLRSTQDLDIYVVPEVFDQLGQLDCFALGKNGFNYRSLAWEKLEITDTFPTFTNIDSLQFLDHTEMLGGVPFLTLDKVVFLKKLLDRPKDRADRQLIDVYLAKGGT